MFSGVGSFGIECLSRGAKNVVFIENYSKVLPILKKNLNQLNPVQNYKIIEEDIYKENSLLNLIYKFDIVFLDPPYKDKNLYKLFEKIITLKILKKNGIIIIHRHRDEKDVFPPKLKIVEEKKYGISKIIFLNS